MNIPSLAIDWVYFTGHFAFLLLPAFMLIILCPFQQLFIYFTSSSKYSIISTFKFCWHNKIDETTNTLYLRVPCLQPIKENEYTTMTTPWGKTCKISHCATARPHSVPSLAVNGKKPQQHKTVWLLFTSCEFCHRPSVKTVTSNKL